MSSNISEFESLYRAAICDPNDAKIEILSSLPREHKPNYIQDMTSKEIKSTIESLISLIKIIVGSESIHLTTSNNNRAGNDIEESLSGWSFELKLGHMTDANIGIETMEWALDLPTKIRDIMASNGYKIRREMYLNNIDKQLILGHKNNSKIEMERLLLTKLTLGEVAPAKLSHTAICISRGITKFDEIRDSYGKVETPSQQISMLVLNKDGKFNMYNKAFPYNEIFNVEKCGLGEQGGGTQVILRGKESQKTIKFLQHFKNSYTDSKSGIKIPAEFWVETPCFNVWIG